MFIDSRRLLMCASMVPRPTRAETGRPARARRVRADRNRTEPHGPRRPIHPPSSQVKGNMRDRNGSWNRISTQRFGRGWEDVACSCGNSSIEHRRGREQTMANEGKERRGRWEGFNLGGGGGRRQRRAAARAQPVAILARLHPDRARHPAAGGQPVRPPAAEGLHQRVLRRRSRQGTVKEVNISPTSISWTTTNNDRFSTALPPQFQTNDLLDQLREQGVPVFTEGQSIWPTIVS